MSPVYWTFPSPKSTASSTSVRWPQSAWGSAIFALFPPDSSRTATWWTASGAPLLCLLTPVTRTRISSFGFLPLMNPCAGVPLTHLGKAGKQKSGAGPKPWPGRGRREALRVNAWIQEARLTVASASFRSAVFGRSSSGSCSRESNAAEPNSEMRTSVA